MTEMESATATVYIPENPKSSRTSSYAAFLNENNITSIRSKSDSSVLLRGPRRVIRLCMFGLILPTLLIIIPLYVRMVMYPPGHYPMMPTDQRILSRHASSLWCKGQYMKMNGSFTTYQADDIPTLKNEKRRHVMLHNTILKDDVKEYWGFHLLEGSRVTVSTCSSREGAQLMILRGIENLKRCAWIGEEDSLEEEEVDEKVVIPNTGKTKEHLAIVTSTFAPDIVEEEIGENIHAEEDTVDNGHVESLVPEAVEEFLGENNSEAITVEDESEERRNNLQELLQKAMRMSKNKKEILRILHSVGRGGRKPLPTNIKRMMGITSDEMNASPEVDVPSPKKKRVKSGRKSGKKSTSKPYRPRLTRAISEDVEEFENGAFERFDDNDENNYLQNRRNIAQHIFYPEGLKFERGKFNQSNYGDRSDEEDHSSYSSSEEALASCEGVILTLPLVSYKSCSYRWTEMNKITYDIPITGTYYFVYSSENEIDSNTIYLNMTFEKVVYDTVESQVVCTNSSDCSVPLSFWGHEEIVVEVPQEDTWNNSYSLDTFCEPRVAVYLTFLLLVPVVILFCAFQ